MTEVLTDYVVNLTSDDIDKLLVALNIAIRKYEREGRIEDSINIQAWYRLSDRFKKGF